MGVHNAVCQSGYVVLIRRHLSAQRRYWRLRGGAFRTADTWKNERKRLAFPLVRIDLASKQSVFRLTLRNLQLQA